jgi:hypothetical protein
MKETKYDKKIVEFLEKKGYICQHNGRLFTRKRFLNIDIDVFGIKDVGRDREKIEVVGVEVKTNKAKISDGIRKAQFYTKFVHKSYLATNLELEEWQKDELRDLGLGLLKVWITKPPKEKIRPKTQKPASDKTEEFLSIVCKLDRCDFCRLHYWDDEGIVEDMFNVIEDRIRDEFGDPHTNFAGKSRVVNICRYCFEGLKGIQEWWGSFYKASLPECYGDYEEEDPECKECYWDEKCKKKIWPD